MLPRQYRLPLRTDLIRVQKEGELFQGRLFSLLIAPQPRTLGLKSSWPGRGEAEGGQNSRFGFILSTKIHKKALRRNRARRLLIEVIRSLLPKIMPGFDCVFLAKKTILGKRLKEVKKEIEKLFRKADLIAD